MAGGSVELHSRSIDETFRATEDEEIIEKAGCEAAAACANNGAPDPVVVTKSEHCKLVRHYVMHIVKNAETLGQVEDCTDPALRTRPLRS